MPSGFEKTFLIVTIGESLIGMLGNGFIAFANCMDWVKTQKLSSGDCVLTGLAISRLSHLWLLLFESFIMALWPHLCAHHKLIVFTSVSWTLTRHFMAWFTTGLSVFYFLKVANLSHPCFLWLRWRVSKVLLALLLGSLVLLFINFALIDTLCSFWFSGYRRYQRNLTWSSDVNTAPYIVSVGIFNLIYLIPFLLSLISLVLLFLSLRRHIKNLQLNGSPRDLSTEAHKRAMKMVTSFLLLLAVHFFSTMFIGWAWFIPQNYQVGLIVMFISTFFPSTHSFILILVNSKLRQTGLHLLKRFLLHQLFWKQTVCVPGQ